MVDDVGKQVIAWLNEIWLWLNVNFFEPERLIEIAVLIIAFFLARIITRWTHKSATRIIKTYRDTESDRKPVGFSQHRIDWAGVGRRFLQPLLSGAIALFFLWSGRFALEPFLTNIYLLPIATSLLTAWIVIRLAVGLIENREFARVVAIFAWALAALNIVGLLDPVIDILDGARFSLGEVNISVLDVIVGVLSFVFFMWLALALSRLIETRIKAISSLPPSAAVLISKSGRIILLAIAFLISLNATGIDLTALAVFGGALGVGIGFGLQKVVGNFISGIILLIDRSIKPGDVIETAGTYGRINKLAARYTSVITRDGTEFLIPNEDMITQPVVNWSHSHKLVRRRIPVQVSYQSDIKKAMSLMVDAASEEQRILANPAPKTLLKGFGADGVDLELRMWIQDPQDGVSNIASDVMIRIWDKFLDNDIEFPYPQRVVHLKTDVPSGEMPNS
ncbi:mechanosensitive ion channel family protein [Kordiimonas sp. SCSIO 12610]|uniref:mechanosensitive ion channel family protein n=1 Tax=Kordiimonas sp. SCSIO 12610 TaxID=2829597 RepID=UPI00210BB4CA|nr:mechanosensitive ion channel domain-containing protein [Kordiimonas sp. SCSIO 12610]UTW54846.1 mechanosensitive ion channel [Kordiimonas sp. SCSIO 12610]